MSLINEILLADTKDMFQLIKSKLNLNNSGIYTDDENYLYIDNNSDILSMSHIDTIARCNELRDNRPLTISESNGIIKANNSVLGADDRAGIYAILRLLESGVKANILFTNYEESGGLGANKFLTDNPELINAYETKLIISFDREGIDQFVCYHDCDKALSKLLLSFGFRESIGTYSDCKDISSFTGIHHINLSVGYYLQHSKNEQLNIKALDNLLIPQYKLLIDYIQNDNMYYICEKEPVNMPYGDSLYSDMYFVEDWDSPLNDDYKEQINSYDINEYLERLNLKVDKYKIK